MLARGGPLPTRGRSSYEVKWDGFRAIVGAGDDFRVRSRRGWDMTMLVPELQQLPPGVYDGEFVAFVDGLPLLPSRVRAAAQPRRRRRVHTSSASITRAA